MNVPHSRLKVAYIAVGASTTLVPLPYLYLVVTDDRWFFAGFILLMGWMFSSAAIHLLRAAWRFYYCRPVSDVVRFVSDDGGLTWVRPAQRGA